MFSKYPKKEKLKFIVYPDFRERLGQVSPMPKKTMTEVREKYEKNNVDGLNFDFSPMDIYDKKKWFLEALTN